jgi:hypothetical protein
MYDRAVFVDLTDEETVGFLPCIERSFYRAPERVLGDHGRTI